jgi:hypothetical protein
VVRVVVVLARAVLAKLDLSRSGQASVVLAPKARTSQAEIVINLPVPNLVKVEKKAKVEKESKVHTGRLRLSR